MKSLFLLLTFGLYSVSSRVCLVHKDGQNESVYFNDRKEVCCGNKLYKREQSGKIMACCKDNVFEPNTELCCGESGFPESRTYLWKNFPYERVCCEAEGKIADSRFNKSCCGGYLMDTTDRGCCGDKTYKISTQTCCENVEKGVSEVYEQRESFQCCDTKLIDTRTSYCSDSDYSVHPIGQELCGEDSFDPTEKLCSYEETLVPRPKFNSSNKYAVPPVYRSREGIIYDDNREKFIPSDNLTNSIAHVVPKDHKTCGNGSYNPNPNGHQEFCCNAVKLNASLEAKVGCCGSQLYNLHNEECCEHKIINISQGCCNGKIYPKQSQECCGNSTIDKEKELCCKILSSCYSSVLKAQNDHNRCCPLTNGTNISYKNTPEIACVNGMLQSTKKEINVPVCSSCGSKQKYAETLKKSCQMQKEFKAIINTITPRPDGTKIYVEIRQPLQYRGHKIELSIQYQCQCFVVGKKIRIYTNRRLHKRPKARLTHRDIIVKSSKKNQKLRSSVCKIGQQFKHLHNN